MDKVSYIKPTYLDYLKNTINSENYKPGKQGWIDDYFDGKDFFASFEKQLPNEIKLKDKSGEKDDLENIKIMHTNLRHVEPRLLANEGVWVYCSHIYFWDYMQKRWVAGREISKKTIKERFFIGEQTDRGLLRNGISRLWFIGHMTYDENNKDNPYHLTEALMSNQEVLTSIAERPSLFRNNIFRIAMLNVVKKNPILLIREKLRELLMYFVFLTGVKRLDSLSIEELEGYIQAKVDQLEDS